MPQYSSTDETGQEKASELPGEPLLVPGEVPRIPLDEDRPGCRQLGAARL